MGKREPKEPTSPDEVPEHDANSNAGDAPAVDPYRDTFPKVIADLAPAAPSLGAALADAKAALSDPPAEDPASGAIAEKLRAKPGRKPLSDAERAERKRERDNAYNAARRAAGNVAAVSDVSAAVKGSRASLAAQLIETQERADRAERAAASAQSASNADVRKMLGGMLSATLRAGSRILAAKRGAHWMMSETEAIEIGDAWALPLSAHWPKIEAYSPYVGAIVVTGSYVILRAQIDAGILTVADLKDRAGIEIQSREIPPTAVVDPPVASPAKVEGAPPVPPGMGDE